MRVRFRNSLGSRDAERHSLDFRECVQGAERDVSEAAGQWLVRKGIATEVVLELPREIKAVPELPSISTADGPEIKAEEKPARGAAKKSNTHQKDE